jgi:hypothetical protein
MKYKAILLCDPEEKFRRLVEVAKGATVANATRYATARRLACVYLLSEEAH